MPDAIRDVLDLQPDPPRPAGRSAQHNATRRDVRDSVLAEQVLDAHVECRSDLVERADGGARFGAFDLRQQ